MAYVEGRIAKSHCLICGNGIEKSNLSSMCNPCKDRVYRHISPPQKAKPAKGKAPLTA